LFSASARSIRHGPDTVKSPPSFISIKRLGIHSTAGHHFAKPSRSLPGNTYSQVHLLAGRRMTNILKDEQDVAIGDGIGSNMVNLSGPAGIGSCS
jgi:hypothetical protein